MADKDKNAAAQASTPSVDVEQQPQGTSSASDHNTLVGALKEAFAGGIPSDHSSLVSALKEAFTKDKEIPQPKIGMDETIPGGKYVKFGTLVNANGDPIDENGNKLKRD